MENIAVDFAAVQTTPLTVAENGSSVTAAHNSAYKRIVQLRADCTTWEHGVFRTSNNQLYALLQKCYQIYLDMGADSEEGRALRLALDEYATKNTVKFHAKTHSLNKILSSVFGRDRRRVSAYSACLKEALVSGVAVSDIPHYIQLAGGVEAIRLTKASDGVTTSGKVSAAKNTLSKKHICRVLGPELSQFCDCGKIGDQVLLIGTWQADGGVVINGVVVNGTVLKNALVAYYSSNKDAIKVTRTEVRAANAAHDKEVTAANASMHLMAA